MGDDYIDKDLRFENNYLNRTDQISKTPRGLYTNQNMLIDFDLTKGKNKKIPLGLASKVKVDQHNFNLISPRCFSNQPSAEYRRRKR